MDFNPSPPTVMHIDLNSCFATVEQQANPCLRGKPVAVAAYTTPRGCILAASREAKQLGVKTGLRVAEGQKLCPELIVLPSDPDKYRFINRRLVELLGQYTPELEVKSIDEMVINLDCYIAKLLNCNNTTIQPASPAGRQYNNFPKNRISEMMINIGNEIKERIKREIGEWLTVSIGIASNRYLAKLASGLHKPDGLDVITRDNLVEVLNRLQLEDLCGIKKGYGRRLRAYGMQTAGDFYRASVATLRAAFNSIVGLYWWQRLHGWDSPLDEMAESDQKSFGQSYALCQPYLPTDPRLWQILCQLSEKMGFRLRQEGYTAGGLHLACLFRDYTFWHRGQKQPSALYANSDFYLSYRRLLSLVPVKPVRLLAISCFRLCRDLYQQESCLEEEIRRRALTRALDALTFRWGDLTVFPARMLAMERRILDRISFGMVKK